VKPENVHLTLKFLGDIDPGQVKPILDVLGRIADNIKPFSLEAKGVGCFPNLRNPRVVWIGIEDGGAKALTLHTSVEDAMEGLGFVKEKRAFRSHLTLGRIKNPKGKTQLVEEIRQIGNRSLGQIDVAALTFFQSQLHRDGAIYTPLGTAELSGGSRIPTENGRERTQ
jgi:2'-5' RNA ligase